MQMFITDFKVETIVNEVIVADANNSFRDYSYFHPSEWNKCRRWTVYQYYKQMGYIKADLALPVVNTTLQKIFDNGHYTHDRCKNYLKKTGVLKGWWMCCNFMEHKTPKMFGKEEKTGIFCPTQCECGCKKFEYCEMSFLDPETNWGGSIDAIVDCSKYLEGDLSQSDRLLVIDFKTINHFNFSKLSGPKKEHYTQMQIYFYLSGLKYGKFVYENKNTQVWEEFLVIRDDEWLEVESKKAKELAFIAKTTNSKGQRVLPPRPYTEASDECSECAYSKLCWKQ